MKDKYIYSHDSLDSTSPYRIAGEFRDEEKALFYIDLVEGPNNIPLFFWNLGTSDKLRIQPGYINRTAEKN